MCRGKFHSKPKLLIANKAYTNNIIQIDKAYTHINMHTPTNHYKKNYSETKDSFGEARKNNQQNSKASCEILLGNCNAQ